MKKLKICTGCKEPRVIWKADGRDKYCQSCWYSRKPGVSKKKTPVPIARVSAKRSKEERIYQLKRLVYLKEHPMCEAHIVGICLSIASQIHHKKGRVGKDLIDEKFFLATCDACHKYIEANPAISIELGFSLKRIN